MRPVLLSLIATAGLLIAPAPSAPGLQDVAANPVAADFFVSPQGSRLTAGAFNKAFAKLIGQIGLEGAGERTRPRAHDLRHSFAVRTLIGWYHAGENVDAKLPLLSTFLGHVDPASTYWYLSASPELIALAAARLNDRYGTRR